MVLHWSPTLVNIIFVRVLCSHEGILHDKVFYQIALLYFNTTQLLFNFYQNGIQAQSCGILFYSSGEEPCRGVVVVWVHQDHWYQHLEGVQIVWKQRVYRKMQSPRRLLFSRQDWPPCCCRLKWQWPELCQKTAIMGWQKSTIWRTIKQDITYSSYNILHCMHITVAFKESREVNAPVWIIEIKQSARELSGSFQMKKNFDQNQNSNNQKDRWICNYIGEGLVVEHSKFLSFLGVLGILCNEGHITPPFFFFNSLSFTTRWTRKLRGTIWSHGLTELLTDASTSSWITINMHVRPRWPRHCS